MSIRLRVIDLPVTICNKCQWGLVYTTITGKRVNRCMKLVDEGSGSQFGLPPVTECNQFEKSGATKWDMERNAWILEVKGQRIVGFKPPKSQTEG